jgi:RecA-family ATPase
MRELPHDFEAEQAVLGALMAVPTAFGEVSLILQIEHFADPLHGRIYRHIHELHNTGQAANPITLKKALNGDSDLENAGGHTYLVGLMSSSLQVAAPAQVAQLLIELHRRRKFIKTAEAAIANSYGEGGHEQVETLSRELCQLAAGTSKAFDNVTFARSLAGQPVPVRPWIVPDWVPMRQVTLLSGDGGVGKSLLALQLMAAASSGTPWIGLQVERVATFGLFAEDDEAELHRRLTDVCRAAGIEISRLPDMAWRSAVVDPCELVEVTDRGSVVPTDYFRRLERTVRELGSRLVVLDAATNLFGGDEIRRRHVNQFLIVLRGLAVRIDGAILLLAHPSAQGLQSKTGMSGSTHWNNAVRSRLYFRAGYDDEGEEDPDPEIRTLIRMKANHASAGTAIKLRWEAGAFVPVAKLAFIDRIRTDGRADQVFLKLLQEAVDRGENVGVAETARNFGPSLFAKRPGRDGVTKAGFKAAMARLLTNGKIGIEQYGRPSDPHSRLVPI